MDLDLNQRRPSSLKLKIDREEKATHRITLHQTDRNGSLLQ